MKTVIISHSEVDSYLLCKMRHFYAFSGDGLEPKKLGQSLYRGTVGHTALEHYYKALLAGSSLSDAADQGITAVRQYGLDPNADFEVLADLTTRILPIFFESVAPFLNWTPLAVEKEFRLEIPTEKYRLIYPFKVDLLIRDERGDIRVVDHKFVYDFYQLDAINLVPQIPKYIGALRALGHHITGGVYNFLRWRKIKSTALEDLYRREQFKPSNARIRQAFTQQVKVMQEIADLKEMGIDDWHSQITRVQNNLVCKSCSFKSICVSEINGEDTTLMKKVEYKPNSYGYSEDVE